MSDYTPPTQDMQFTLEDVLGFTHEELDSETITAILDEASKLARDELAPLNATGDQHGARIDTQTGDVTTAPGFKDAYANYRDGGWNAVPFDPDYGGQGLPWAIAFPVQEMWQGANMSFGLCPLLNQGAVEAISAHGSQDLKDTYLENLISGQWTGTMNLTEPQAGSDLGLLSAKAVPNDDGTFKISGQKIYITYGDHDMADNIIHLVLARLPDAPDDVKGISLFVVPKFLPNSGARNAVKCIGLEHKLGIHASPTCTMDFDGATGFIVGEPHMGLRYMFTMMNNARLSVGLQGVAIAERAYQHALSYAQERVQGKSADTGERVSIDHHPDVKRMLLEMRSCTEAGRALTYQAALALDSGDELVHLLTPLVKSWCTDMSVSVASLGIQVHGGMGFVEETGAAQYMRDARILPIYEGTNGIQAADLVFRKVLRDQGTLALRYIGELKDNISPDHQGDVQPYLNDLTGLIKAIGAHKDINALSFAAKPCLDAFALIAGACLLSRSAIAIQSHSDPDFAAQKIESITFFIQHILPRAHGHLISARHSL